MAGIIEATAVVLHAFGSILIALSLITLAVVLRRYWLRMPVRKFLFMKIPREDFFLLFTAMFFLLLSFLFLLAIFTGINPSMQWPRLVAIFFLILGNAGACFSLYNLNKFFAKKKGLA